MGTLLKAKRIVMRNSDKHSFCVGTGPSLSVIVNGFDVHRGGGGGGGMAGPSFIQTSHCRAQNYSTHYLNE